MVNHERTTSTGRIVNDEKELMRKALTHGQGRPRIELLEPSPESLQIATDIAALERRMIAACGIPAELLR